MNETAVKERPILMADGLVKATLAGRKTQTRRPVKPQPELRDDGWIWCPPGAKYEPRIDDWIPSAHWREELNPTDCGAAGIVDWCPFGKPGDRLWVRECWGDTTDWDHFNRHCPRVKAFYRATEPDACIRRWRPSIHMPRWASRLTLEITNVRVERVQEISHADAIAEGVPTEPFQGTMNGEPATIYPIDPTYMFGCAWNSHYAKTPYAWAANPWVWVLDYKVVK